MIEFKVECDSGREAYRQVLTESDHFSLTVGDQACEVIDISENGIAYRVQLDLDDSLIAAALEFELDGNAISINCNLQRVRKADDVHCCVFTALSKVHHMILSRYIMQCQKRSIREAR